MDVRKTIAELTSQLSEINYYSEEENVLLKDSNPNDVCHSAVEDNDYEDVAPSKLRKTTDSITLPDSIYGGKTTTRKKNYPLIDSSDNESLKDTRDDYSSDDNDEENIERENEGGSEEDDLSEEEEESQVISDKSFKPNKNEDGVVVDFDIYSAGSKNIPSDVKKGAAIRKQLRIWESLLECRIKLQKALSACNSLPIIENVIKLQLDSEHQLKLNKCKKNLIHLIGDMVDLQEELLKQCQEFKKSKRVCDEPNEEIPSDESERDGVDEDEEEQPLRKKRKLNDYSSLIKDNHNKFIQFRNASIQKWNDKTKVSTGKMANSNFSAFDQSTLKQIEQIMVDKNRLINRTRMKRIDSQSGNIKNQAELSQNSQEITLNAEIFDDTDFYHKLLRDYIERKSVDVTNSSHTERQMVELQKLRSKMKKNVDTKSTKGRKLRYIVIPKLVNFMAPDPYTTWNEQAETELYNSLFGKIKVN